MNNNSIYIQETDARVHVPVPSKTEQEAGDTPQFKPGEYVFTSKDIPLINEPDIPAGIDGIVTEGNHVVGTVEMVRVKFCDPWNTRGMFPDSLTHGPSGLIARKTADGWRFTGSTYHYRRHLREANCTWDKDAKVWRLSGDALPDAIYGLLVGRFVAEHTGDGWRFTGGTYPHRSTFREAGCTWDRKAQVWTCKGEMPAAIRAILEGEPSGPAPKPVKPKPSKAAKRAATFRELADNMESDIQEKLNPAIAHLNSTPRRNGIVAGMVSDGLHLKKVQAALRGLADAWEAGTVPGSLKGLRYKVEVDYLVYYKRFPSAGGWGDKDNKRMQRAGIKSQADYDQARADLLALIDPQAGEPDELDELRQLEREIALKKIPGYFPTPPAVVDRLLSEAAIEPGNFVLEPSAGAGHIADTIRERHPDAMLGCIEINGDLAKLLKLKEHEHVGWDFLELDPAEWGYMDRIVMNPPFERGQDIDHVRHAYALLAPGGRLVSVVCEGPFFRSDKKSQGFREWLDQVGGWSEPLPADAFKSSDRPTGVRTRVVVIDKLAAQRGV